MPVRFRDLFAPVPDNSAVDRRRRLLWGLAIAVVGCVIAPLAYDWFIAVPWSIRWWLGQGCVFVLVGLGVRLLVRRGDSIESVADAAPVAEWAATRSEPRTARWLPLALHVLVASLAFPLLRRPDAYGLGDWDLHLQWYEAARQTIVRWHQVPWWNPWVRGGFPLAAEPQFGLVSIDTPLVLLFGTSVGLRVATVCYLMLAVEGARRLAASWLADPWAAAVAGAVYGLNGAILIYTAAGHALTMSHPFLPWLLHCVVRLGRDRWAAMWLGFWAAASILAVIQYPTAYACLIAGAFWLRSVATSRGDARRQKLADTIVAAGVFLVLAGWRIAVTASVLADFPRHLSSLVDRSPIVAVAAMLARPLPPFSFANLGEGASYVGALTVLLVGASFIRRWRCWHVLIVLTFWLSLGSQRFFQLSYWLRDWPAFSTMHMVSRWRLPLMLGMSLAAASMVGWLRRNGGRVAQLCGAAIAVGISGDLIVYAHQLLPVAFSLPPREDWYPGPPIDPVVNIESWETSVPEHGIYWQTLGFAATRRGYGVVRGYEPQLGYDRSGATARVWRGHSDYQGEFWTSEGPLTPAFWSPNRVVLKTKPNQRVYVNANPGSWWRVNGRRLFESMRCAEWAEPFAVEADPSGHLVLEIAPRGLRLALFLTMLGAGLLVGGSLWRRKPTLRAVV